MNYIYQRNITEIKNEFTSFLNDLLTPFIYEGLKSVYVFSMKTHKEYLDKDNSQARSPGVLKIFQLLLKTIPTLNRNCMETETNRIRNGTKCAGCFDDLVKATIKSKIILLTFTNPKNCPNILKEKHHEKVDIIDFLHKCYIESARIVYNNPELFWHEFTPLEIKRNQREICELIKLGIGEGIRRVLPLKEILGEYLSSDYDFHESEKESNYNEQDYQNILEMVKDFLNKENKENMGNHGFQHGFPPEKLQYHIPNKDTSKYLKEGILETSDHKNFSGKTVNGRMDRSDTRNDESESNESGSESDHTSINSVNISNNLENLYDEIASVTNNENQFFDLVNRVNNIEKGQNNTDITYKGNLMQTNNENETIGHNGFIPQAEKDTEIQRILKDNIKANYPSNKTSRQINEILNNMEGKMVKNDINNNRLPKKSQNNPKHNPVIDKLDNQSDKLNQITNLLANPILNHDESKIPPVPPTINQNKIVSHSDNISANDNNSVNENNKEIFAPISGIGAGVGGGDLNNNEKVKFFEKYMK